MSMKTATAAAEERRAAGPYAFPTAYAGEHEGMTLRDSFAGRAMQGLISELSSALADPKNSGTLQQCANNTARLSYAIADAMIKAREKR